jgi:signal transduction histidine kinase
LLPGLVPDTIGVDVGLAVALNAIVAETARQDDAAIAANVDPHTQDARTYEAASTALLKVAKTLAARFRQKTTR